MDEEWRVVEKFPMYEVSNKGNVRNAKSKRPVKGCATKNKPTDWYPMVSIHQKHRYVHRLVAETFIPNPDNLPQVNHINGQKNDNRVENLEWTDASRNQIHAINTGLHKKIDGCCKGRRPVRVENLETGESTVCPTVQSASRMTGIDARVVSKICQGTRRCSKPEYRLQYETDSVID